MKIITISKIGYNHPSQANWSYTICKIDLINTEEKYCMSYTIKANFGGETRLQQAIKEKTGYDMLETKGVYTKTGTPNITGISTMLDAEGQEIEKNIIEFLTKK